MARILFEVPRAAAEKFGSARYDLESGGLRWVVHLHRHPPTSPYAGAPCLMTSVLPDPIPSADFPVFPDATDEQWGLGISGSLVLQKVRAAMIAMESAPRGVAELIRWRDRQAARTVQATGAGPKSIFADAIRLQTGCLADELPTIEENGRGDWTADYLAACEACGFDPFPW